MDKGSPVAVWFSAEDRRRAEEAAALAGYRHLSKYIKDRVFDRRPAGLSQSPALAEPWGGEHAGNGLADLELRQRRLEAMCVMLLFLARTRATGGEANELVAACQQALAPGDVLGLAFPQLAAALQRLSDEP